MSAFADAGLVMIGEYGHLHALRDEQFHWKEQLGPAPGRQEPAPPPEVPFPPETRLVPGVLPRLVVGLTRGGSLAGLFGFTVQT